MKSKTNENIIPGAETAEKAVATPAKGIAEEVLDVRPSETVSIVAGNRLLFLGEGLKEIRIKR